eukprot:COSAG02_NODE_9706_length_2136_cov_16.219440_1_plen_58_part_10
MARGLALYDSTDGETGRKVLACEALEECAIDPTTPSSTDEVSVIGHQVAWRLARRAGI